MRSDRYRQRKHRALANHYRKKNKKNAIFRALHESRGGVQRGARDALLCTWLATQYIIIYKLYTEIKILF
nr:MAG TPA: hypothetical protein [Caudoviricetes sp.]